MMIRSTFFVLATVYLAATLPACSKKSDGATGSSKTAEKAGPTKLPKLGLQIDVPGNVTVGDAIMGEGHMLEGESIGAMQIEVADSKKSIDDAKSDADLYSPKDLKADTLADGWALAYSNTGSMGKNFFIDVQRDIGGKTYHCSTTGSEQKQADTVLAACKTLRQ